jgi:hypothetical protein
MELVLFAASEFKKKICLLVAAVQTAASKYFHQ